MEFRSISTLVKQWRSSSRANGKQRQVFGIPLLQNVQKNGQPLPLPMQYALQYLRRTAIGCQGLFRKSGVKTRIARLRHLMETNPDDSDKIFGKDDFSPYDIADLVKMYFRELPEPLMTKKLSHTFISIFSGKFSGTNFLNPYPNLDSKSYSNPFGEKIRIGSIMIILDLPPQTRLRALQAAILLLPDENREVLQTLLYFLSDIAHKKDENQMPPSNLAVCFAPSLFHLQMNQKQSSRFSSLRLKDGRKAITVPDENNLSESVAAHHCFTYMIKVRI